MGQTFQSLESVSPRTYIGSGKTLEVEGAVDELDADTVIFDDELTPGQLRNLEKAWGDRIRLCDRTALILDIFSQRAATKEGQLQVRLLHLRSCCSPSCISSISLTVQDCPSYASSHCLLWSKTCRLGKLAAGAMVNWHRMSVALACS